MKIDKELVADEIMNTLPTLFKGMFKNSIRDSEGNESHELFGPHMSGSHLHVIFAIEKLGPCPISNIAKKLFISKPNMTPIIDKLLSMGLIKREYSQKDRRVINVCTTEEGKTFIKEKKEKIRNTIAEKLSGLGNEDITELYNALVKIRNIVGKLSTEDNNCSNSGLNEETR